MQGRGTVQQYGMFFDYVFQYIPYSLVARSTIRLGALDVGGGAGFHQALHHKGLEQFQCHFFRQTALVHFHFRPTTITLRPE